MKNTPFAQESNPAGSKSAPNPGPDPSGADFIPCPEEVARAAYFCYVNEGSPEGRHVQHWLDAEADLIRERNKTRTHAFNHHA